MKGLKQGPYHPVTSLGPRGRQKRGIEEAPREGREGCVWWTSTLSDSSIIILISKGNRFVSIYGRRLVSKKIWILGPDVVERRA